MKAVPGVWRCRVWHGWNRHGWPAKESAFPGSLVSCFVSTNVHKYTELKEGKKNWKVSLCFPQILPQHLGCQHFGPRLAATAQASKWQCQWGALLWGAQTAVAHPHEWSWEVGMAHNASKHEVAAQDLANGKFRLYLQSFYCWESI